MCQQGAPIPKQFPGSLSSYRKIPCILSTPGLLVLTPFISSGRGERRSLGNIVISVQDTRAISIPPPSGLPCLWSCLSLLTSNRSSESMYLSLLGPIPNMLLQTELCPYQPSQPAVATLSVRTASVNIMYFVRRKHDITEVPHGPCSQSFTDNLA